MSLIDSYFNHLVQNPERIDSLLMWTVCTIVTWFAEWFYRKDIVEGLKGVNKLFESSEVVIFVILIMFPPIIYYSVFFNVNLPVWNWYFIMGTVAFAMGGRWIFEWVLALRAGATTVQETKEEVKVTTTTTETQEK